MYNGYLLKINGVVFPEKYIADGTFQPIEKRIVVNDYLDGAYNRHIVYAPEKEVTITFNLARMLESDAMDALAMLDAEEFIVEYYKAGSYSTGLFTISESTVPQIVKIINGYVIFGSQPIKLIRKQVV